MQFVRSPVAGQRAMQPFADVLEFDCQHRTFVGCHQHQFIDRVDVLRFARKGATLLLNCSYGPDEVWSHLPRDRKSVV